MGPQKNKNNGSPKEKKKMGPQKKRKKWVPKRKNNGSPTEKNNESQHNMHNTELRITKGPVTQCFQNSVSQDAGCRKDDQSA